jgi:hypothetical protein
VRAQSDVMPVQKFYNKHPVSKSSQKLNKLESTCLKLHPIGEGILGHEINLQLPAEV